MRVIIQGIIGQSPEKSGTFEAVTGFTGGSSVVTCNAFINKRVYIDRSGVLNPGIDPGDGSLWHTKVLADNFITFNTPLIDGEILYIETI